MRNNDEMERWRLREIKRELLEIAARARVSTADHAAALLAEAKRIERVIRGLTANPRIPRRKPENPRAAQRSNKTSRKKA